MNWDGYLINVKTLVKGFPETLRAIEALLRDRGSWDVAYQEVQKIIQDFVRSEIDPHLITMITGEWYFGDRFMEDSCPFVANEAYVLFEYDQLIDEVRKSGRSVRKDSALFVKLKTFMRKHDIGENEVTFEEWMVQDE